MLVARPLAGDNDVSGLAGAAFALPIALIA